MSDPVSAAKDASKAEGLPVCGAVFDHGSAVLGFRPEDMGCGKPFDREPDIVRCARCMTPFHQGCAERHFGWPEAGGSFMPHSLDAGLAALRTEYESVIEASIQDLALGTPERIQRAEQRLRAALEPIP